MLSARTFSPAEVLPAPPSPLVVGVPALTVVQPAGEGERAVLDVEGEVVDVQAAGGHHLDGFEVLHLPMMADVNVGDVWGLSNIHTEGMRDRYVGWRALWAEVPSAKWHFRGELPKSQGFAPCSAFLIIPLQAFLPTITSALPRLLPSPSPRSVCDIVSELSGGTGNTLNPHRVGMTPDSFMGRASSSAAVLAFYCLHKAFLLISGSHTQHSEGNY